MFTPGSCLVFPTNQIGLHFLIHLSPSICLGVSSTFAGQRLSKDDRIFEALGANDELSSTIGYGAYYYCRERVKKMKQNKQKQTNKQQTKTNKQKQTNKTNKTNKQTKESESVEMIVQKLKEEL